jgi:hypothetical protein
MIGSAEKFQSFALISVDRSPNSDVRHHRESVPHSVRIEQLHVKLAKMEKPYRPIEL